MTASAVDLTGPNCMHVCVDMQAMFSEPTDWHAPWMERVLPAVEAIVEQQPAKTVFTRFIPPASAAAAPGAWRKYYERWASMTRDRLPPDLLQLVPTLTRHVPPARVVDKPVYSPWYTPALHSYLQERNTDTLIVTGGETDVCVLATVLGAIDHGYRVVVPTDAVFSSADATHDAMIGIYHSRFAMQLTACETQDILDEWRD